jgi:hypothetical protein
VRRNHGRVGAAEGPAALRAMLSNLPTLDDTPLYDAGDVDCADGDLEGAQARYAERLAALLDAGHFPVGLGGGHEIAFATYQGLARHLGKRRPRVAIVNIDAHFDLRRQERGSSGTPFLQALEHAAALGLPLDYCVYGISAAANTRALFDTAALRHATCRMALDLEKRTWRAECATGPAGVPADPGRDDEKTLAQRFPDEQDPDVRRLLARTAFGRFQDRLVGERALPGRTGFGPVHVEGRRDAIEDGTAYLNFFPGGQAQRAWVPVVDGDNRYTVVVEPFTGRARVVPGVVEVKE